MSETVTFYYDFSSPYAYLGSTQIERVARAHGARVRFRPMLLGALFKAIGTPMVPIATFPEPKRRYYQRDVHDWARYWSVDFRWPSRFPMRTVAALRLALAAGEESLPRVSHALYRAYWVEDRDLADEAVLRQIAAGEGLDEAVVQRALLPDPQVKNSLIALTDEAIAAGVCGAPSFIVDGHLFWGQDRIDLVERVLTGWQPPREL